MRIVSSRGLISYLFLALVLITIGCFVSLLSTNALAQANYNNFNSGKILESGEISIPQKFYAATTVVPQVYTYVLRPISGQTQNIIELKDQLSSFESVTTNAPYRIGTLTLTHYKLSREPISKFSLAKRTYEYITLESNTTVLTSDAVQVKISFHVDKSWLSGVGGRPDQIALFVFDEDTWRRLDTKLTQTTGNFYEYDAYTSLFGYFAIALDRPLQGSETSASASSASSTSGNGGAGTSSSSSATASATKPASNSGTVTVPLSQQSDSNSQNAQAPQVVDAKTQAVDVVYPLLDGQDSNSGSSMPLQKWIGYGLLFFAVTGVIIVGVTVAQSRSNKTTPYKTNASVNELLAQLASNRTIRMPKPASMSSDINALLQKVHAKYQPTFSTPKSTFSSGTSAFADSLSHSIDDLKQKVAQLEPDLVQRYTDWGMSHGHNLATIKQDLISHDIDESVVNKILSSHWKKF